MSRDVMAKKPPGGHPTLGAYLSLDSFNILALVLRKAISAAFIASSEKSLIQYEIRYL